MKELQAATILSNAVIVCKLYHPKDKKIKYHLTALEFYHRSYGYASKTLPCS